MTLLTSKNGSIIFGEGHPTLLINDQLRIMDQSPQVLSELCSGKYDTLLSLARRGKALGLEVVDILIAHPNIDEVDMLPRVAAAVMNDIGCCLSLDSRNPSAIEATLKVLHPYKVLINSVSAEPDVMNNILPLAARYDASIVVMPMGLGIGVPHTTGERLEAANVVIDRAQRLGIPREDIVVDGIVLATAVEPDSMIISLQTLRALVDQLNVTTILGISNASHGMPMPFSIDLAYLVSAIPWGLHAALINPEIPGIIETVHAADFLNNRDPYGRRFIAYYRQTIQKVKVI